MANKVKWSRGWFQVGDRIAQVERRAMTYQIARYAQAVDHLEIITDEAKVPEPNTTHYLFNAGYYKGLCRALEIMRQAEE